MRTIDVPLTNDDSYIPVHKGRELKAGTLRGLIEDMDLTVDEYVKML